MTTLRRTSTILAASLAGLACLITGCGSTAASTTSASGKPKHWATAAFENAVPALGGTGQTGPVIVRVGSVTVRRSAILALVGALARESAEAGKPAIVPLPPTFSSCVKQLSAEAAGFGTSSSTSPAALRAKCANSYSSLVSQAVTQFISSAWVLQSAKTAGISSPLTSLRESLAKQMSAQYPTRAAFEVASRSGANPPAERLSRVERELIVQHLFNKVKTGVGRVTSATLSNYYSTHRAEYTIPETRNLGFIHTFHRGTAKQALKELKAGTSFQTVAARLSHEQRAYSYPLQRVFSREGLLLGLKPLFFHEPVLNDPIFKTPLHQFGPIVHVDLFPGYQPRFHRNAADINNIDGYYVYKVMAIHPTRVTPLAAVKSQLARALPERLDEAAVTSYIRSWRAGLRAITYCAPGYVVRKCRDYAPVAGELPEEPDAFS